MSNVWCDLNLIGEEAKQYSNFGSTLNRLASARVLELGLNKFDCAVLAGFIDEIFNENPTEFDFDQDGGVAYTCYSYYAVEKAKENILAITPSGEADFTKLSKPIQEIAVEASNIFADALLQFESDVTPTKVYFAGNQINPRATNE